MRALRLPSDSDCRSSTTSPNDPQGQVCVRRAPPQRSLADRRVALIDEHKTFPVVITTIGTRIIDV
jgi:hypothetical protein